MGFKQLFTSNIPTAYGVAGSVSSITKQITYGKRQSIKAQNRMNRFLVTCISRRDIRVMRFRVVPPGEESASLFRDSTLIFTETRAGREGFLKEREKDKRVKKQ